MAFTQFIVLAILAVLVPSILGTEFMVGDDKGWTINFDYQNWAKGKEFHVGDKLDGWASLLQNKGDVISFAAGALLLARPSANLFQQYPSGAYNVVKVNGTGFQQCAIPAPAGNETLTSGNDVITLAIAGNKWYICGVAKHCEVENQKLTIAVSENNSSVAFAPTWMMAIFGILMMVMV